MAQLATVALIASLVVLTLAVLPLPVSAWNIPGHMLSAAIAYEILRQENPRTIDKIIAVLEKHPWYANQWQARLQDVPVTDRDMVFFMQAARWPDDIRFRDKQHHRGPWHYINWPFKPEGQPAIVQTRDPEPVNILTAMAENESVVKNESDSERKAIALAWLFHLVGDNPSYDVLPECSVLVGRRRKRYESAVDRRKTIWGFIITVTVVGVSASFFSEPYHHERNTFGGLAGESHLAAPILEHRQAAAILFEPGYRVSQPTVARSVNTPNNIPDSIEHGTRIKYPLPV